MTFPSSSSSSKISDSLSSCDDFQIVIDDGDDSPADQNREILNLQLSNDKFSANQIRCYIEALLDQQTSFDDATEPLVYQTEKGGRQVWICSPCSDKPSLIGDSSSQDMPTLADMAAYYSKKLKEEGYTPDEILIPFAQNRKSRHWVMIRVQPKTGLVEYLDPRPVPLSPLDYSCSKESTQALSTLVPNSNQPTPKPQYLGIQGRVDSTNCGRYVCAMLRESIEHGDNAKLKRVNLSEPRNSSFASTPADSPEHLRRTISKSTKTTKPATPSEKWEEASAVSGIMGGFTMVGGVLVIGAGAALTGLVPFLAPVGAMLMYYGAVCVGTGAAMIIAGIGCHQYARHKAKQEKQLGEKGYNCRQDEQQKAVKAHGQHASQESSSSKSQVRVTKFREESSRSPALFTSQPNSVDREESMPLQPSLSKSI